MADDEVFNLQALKGVLKILGLKNLNERVDTVFNGEELVQKVKTAIEEDDPLRYSLILTDCSMPIKDGYEAAKEVRQLYAGEIEKQRSLEGFPRIIAITGHVEPDYFKKAFDKGIDKVFPKPLPVLELGEELQNLGFISEIPQKILNRG